jgi:tetraprenyl-beta-curcumene synthase
MQTAQLDRVDPPCCAAGGGIEVGVAASGARLRSHLSIGSLLALARACMRQLVWARPRVLREAARWEARASRIADERVRAHALASLREKRNLSFGAAFFCILPRRRNASLLRLLVAFEAIWDFLDLLSEDLASGGAVSCAQLHLALVEALTPDAPASDYYRFHLAEDDGGYLRALVETCQAECSRLPSYSRIMPLILDGVANCSVQAINHEHSTQRRAASLRRWASEAFPEDRTTPWFELAAAASAFMPHALLALASEPDCTEGRAARVCAGYFPSVSVAIVMLDSYVDRAEDLARGGHSYLAYYGDERTAVSRLIEIIQTMESEMRELGDRHRHAVIAGCMVAMFLSRDDAHAPSSSASTRQIVEQCDGITRLVLPLLRVFRDFGGVVGASGAHAAEPAVGFPLAQETGRC